MNERYRVLIPLDGSRLAERALAYLPALSRLGDLEVALLGVVDNSDEALRDDEARDRESKLLGAYLEQVQAGLGSRFDIAATSDIETGIPAEVILQFEERLSPAMTVIATHGRTGVLRWRLGSVADKVIRGARSNTLVIGPHVAGGMARPEDAGATGFRNLLVPLDGSALSEQALPVADRFVNAFGAKLHLLRVLTPMIYTEKPVGPEFAPPAYFLTIPQAEEYLHEAARQLSRPSETVRRVERGSPEDRITEYTATNAIDLIVLTTHGRGGFARVAIGSVIDHLLGGPVPLLIVRSGPVGA
jgi:nucleotide-binding universal stress UspA family protein